MSPSFATAINIVLDAAVVTAILSLMIWGIVTNRREARRLRFVERRSGRASA